MSNTFRNVHTYDNMWKGRYFPTQNWSNENKKTLFQQLLRRLSNPAAKQMVQIIMNDQSQNYDVSNDANASDILADICSIPVEDGELQLLEEQLADNFMLGKCSQGRTTRLYQILIALRK
jgi:hypothetical protein